MEELTLEQQKQQRLTILIVGLCFLDIVTTLIGLKLGAKEINQITLLIGISGFLILKAIISLILGIVLFARSKGKQLTGKTILLKSISSKWMWIAVSIMCIVVINNIVTIAIEGIK